MAIDGLKPTGKFFEGSRFVAQAHYPSAADYVEESFDTPQAARDFMAAHTRAGANVQLHEHTWTEQFIAYGWHPARKPKATA